MVDLAEQPTTTGDVEVTLLSSLRGRGILRDTDLNREEIEAILDLVAAGGGFTVLSRWSLRPGLMAIPLTAAGTRARWSLLRRAAERDAEVLALADRVAGALRTREG